MIRHQHVRGEVRHLGRCGRVAYRGGDHIPASQESALTFARMSPNGVQHGIVAGADRGRAPEGVYGTPMLIPRASAASAHGGS